MIYFPSEFELCASSCLCPLQVRCRNGRERLLIQLGEGAGVLTHISSRFRLLVGGFVAFAEVGDVRL